MKALIITLTCMVAIPFVIKLGLLYFAYIQWALAVPIPFSVRLFRRSEGPQKPKKQPIGFMQAFEEEPEGVPVGKKKK